MNLIILNWLKKLWLTIRMRVNNVVKFMENTMSGDTIVIDGITYTKNSPELAIDYISKEYYLSRNTYIVYQNLELHRQEGFLGFNDAQRFGINVHNLERYTQEGKLLDFRTRDGNYYILDSYRITGSGKIHQSIDDPNIYFDDYMHIRHNKAEKFRAFNNTTSMFDDLDNPLISDEDKKLLIKRDFDFGVRSNTFRIFEGLTNTFGVELETSSGRLSNKDVEGLNLRCEFDGSLRETPDQRKEDVLGGEYITGVLVGDAGMFQLQKICNTLAEKCKINNKAGVHVHVGGIKFTKENIVYLYILGLMLQDEIYQMLPASRRKNVYCRKIDELPLSINSLKNCKTSIAYDILIDEYYNKIFQYVSHGKTPDRNTNRKGNHPMGSKCGYNKDTQRYCWLNFVTALFNTKGNSKAITLEFRNHSATLNYEKIKNWIKICFAFVSFAENHKNAIRNNFWVDKNNIERPIDLTTVVMATYPKSGKSLSNYIDTRKNKFLFDDGSIESEEYKTDKLGVKKLSLKEIAACV